MAHRKIVLAPEAFDLLVAELDKPAKPTDELKELMSLAWTDENDQPRPGSYQEKADAIRRITSAVD